MQNRITYRVIDKQTGEDITDRYMWVILPNGDMKYFDYDLIGLQDTYYIVQAEQGRYIKLDDLKKFPIRRDHYDKIHGNEHFVNGVESVLEYAEHLPIYEIDDIKRA